LAQVSATAAPTGSSSELSMTNAVTFRLVDPTAVRQR